MNLSFQILCVVLEKPNNIRAIPTAGCLMCKDDSIIHCIGILDFVSNTTCTKKMFGLLKHECYHLIYQHVVLLESKNHTLMWNIATDLAINSTIPLD